MIIETKFNQGQKVFVIFENTIVSGTVGAINVCVGWKGIIEIEYAIEFEFTEEEDNYEVVFLEGKVYGTPNDIIKHLKK